VNQLINGDASKEVRPIYYCSSKASGRIYDKFSKELS
jgi:hypothetical protein